MIFLFGFIIAVLSLGLLVKSGDFSRKTVVIHCLFVLFAIIASVDMSGLPKPLSMEVRDSGKLIIKDAQYHPGKAIYIWVKGDPPRVYKLPWDVNMARKIQEAQKRSSTDGVVLNKGKEEYGSYSVNPEPVPPDPPKDKE